jgi:hypothetical protein
MKYCFRVQKDHFFINLIFKRTLSERYRAYLILYYKCGDFAAADKSGEGGGLNGAVVLP